MTNGSTPDETAVLGHLRSFLCDLVGTDDLGAEEDLVASGLLNSLMLFELFVFLEKDFDVHVTGADVHADNFRTPSRLARFVRAKRAGTLDTSGDEQ